MCKLKVLSEDSGIVSGVTGGRGPPDTVVRGDEGPLVTRSLDSQQEVRSGGIY